MAYNPNDAPRWFQIWLQNAPGSVGWTYQKGEQWVGWLYAQPSRANALKSMWADPGTMLIVREYGGG